MPRKTYRPKNRFVVKSKLGEMEFATLVWLYLQGMSAPQARAAFAAMDHPSAANPPSEKTISNIFRRLGRYIFHRLVEPAFILAFPDYADLRAHSKEAYDFGIDAFASAMVDYALGGLSYNDFRAMQETNPLLKGSDAIMMEIRKLSAVRQGIKIDPRADIGLSQLRMITVTRLARGKSEEEQLNLMLKTLLDWLLFEPLDEDGNPNQLFRDRPLSFPYGNFGLPNPDYSPGKKPKR